MIYLFFFFLCLILGYELTLLQRKKASDILTTGKNAILSADGLHVEEQHFTHRWKGKLIFLSITGPRAKRSFNHMGAARQDDNIKQDSVCL